MTGLARELTEDDLARLRVDSIEGRQPIKEMCDRLALSIHEAGTLLAHRLSMEWFDGATLSALRPDTERLPLAIAQQAQCALLFPRQTDAGGSRIAVLADPFDDDLVIQLQHRVDGPCTLAISAPDEIQAYLRRWEDASSAFDAVPEQTAVDADKQHVEILSLTSTAEAGSRAVALVNSTLIDAYRAGASDVHLESTDSGLAVRCRIDGVLDLVRSIAGRELAEQIISRIKVLAGLDIAEHRVPQDGSYRVRVRDREVDLRVSVMPSVHGEDAVLRILDKQALIETAGKLSLESLGFDAPTLIRLRRLLDEPYGMVLVTGPTGSGKTTTLYAALTERYTGAEKVITIEDPVEYQLQGMLQIPVNEKKQLTFARGLRSILRHDPDIIMVGEIRDRETAEIAVQSALTGHLVLSTVHANSVLDVFSRFAHMGLDTYALVSAINGVWAQRLIRLNCPRCSQPDRPSHDLLMRSGLGNDDLESYAFKRGIGCGECRNSGYRGRRAVAEILHIDSQTREMLLARKPLQEIRDAAVRQQGMRGIAAAALDLVRTGQTTLDEVRRVATSL